VGGIYRLRRSLSRIPIGALARAAVPPYNTGMSKRPDADDAKIAAAKWCLAELVAGGTMLSDALRQLKINWRKLAAWRKSDATFAEDIRDAQAHLAQIKADELCRLHETCADAKMANVIANVWKWRIEKMAPAEFGPKPEPPQENSTLLEIISEAIRRIGIPERVPSKSSN
jgi:hypothetical protein